MLVCVLLWHNTYITTCVGMSLWMCVNMHQYTDVVFLFLYRFLECCMHMFDLAVYITVSVKVCACTLICWCMYYWEWINVCLHAFLRAWTHGRVLVCRCVFLHTLRNGCWNESMHACTHSCMYLSMHVCFQVFKKACMLMYLYARVRVWVLQFVYV